jgi:glutathione S-transferase
MLLGDKTIALRTARNAAPIRFYSAWFCPFAHRAWLALEAKQLDYQWVECELYSGGSGTKKALTLEEKAERTPGFVECCPRGLVPGVEHDGVRVCESLPLIEYLDEAYPDSGCRLMPASPADRAIVRMWIGYASEKVVPCYYRMLMAPDDAGRDKAKEELLSGLRYVSERAFKSPEGPFLMGTTFGAFECALFPHWLRFGSVLRHYRGFEVPAGDDAFAQIVAWGEACAAHHAAAATIVDHQRIIESNTGYADNTATSTAAVNTRAGSNIAGPPQASQS